MPLSRFHRFAALAIAIFGSPAASHANEEARPVVAHWIVPMNYESRSNYMSPVKDDVRAAIELGIDGFAVNAFSGQQARSELSSFINAANQLGASQFKVFLSADMSLKFTAQEIVRTIEDFGNDPHYLQIDGKPLLSTYGGGGLGDTWWKDNVLIPLSNANKPVTFIPYFDRPNPNGDAPSYKNWRGVLNRFPSVDGLFNFLIAGSTPFYESDPDLGRHWWSVLTGEEELARATHDSGKLFMAPYLPYYWAVCHPARQYMEYQGGRGMANQWQSIILRQKADIVEIVTWNDYAESTFIQPTRYPLTKTPGIESFPHLGYYELLKYYISWYRSGIEPQLTRDGVFFFYRVSSKDIVPSGEHSSCRLGPISASQKWGNIQDVVYVTAALIKPATLIVTSGSVTERRNLPAGLNTVDIPFHEGAQTFALVRDGAELVRATGAPIVASPRVENYNVYSGYAIAGGQSSASWRPSDAWKTGFVADWFAQPAPSAH
ncbi:MAG: endo-1,3-alpha-glucanase family glycosylhydrolase [Alphaproteobacteria bacterium]